MDPTLYQIICDTTGALEFSITITCKPFFNLNCFASKSFDFKLVKEKKIKKKIISFIVNYLIVGSSSKSFIRFSPVRNSWLGKSEISLLCKLLPKLYSLSLL